MQKGDLKLNNLQVAFLIRLAVILIDYQLTSLFPKIIKHSDGRVAFVGSL